MICLLLPLGGFLAGIWLKPEPRPRWHMVSSDKIRILGYVEKGNTLLVLQYPLAKDATLLGLNGRTGAERFRQSLSEAQLGSKAYFHESTSLSRDGRLLLINAAIKDDSRRYVLCYDWQTGRVLHRFAVQSTTYLEKILLTGDFVFTFSGTSLVKWKISASDQPPTLLPLGHLGKPDELIDHISDDGELLYQYQRADGQCVFHGLAQSPHVLKLRSPLFSSILEMRDRNQFRVAELSVDNLTPSYLIRTYVLQGNEYVLIPEKDLRLEIDGTLYPQQDGLVIRGRITEKPWKNTVREKIGEKWFERIQWLFPSEASLSLFVFERSASKHLGTIPAPPWNESWRYCCSPEQQTLALEREGRIIESWDLSPFIPWYPTSGLLLGLLLSLSWIFYRFSRQTKQLNPPLATGERG